MAVWTVVADLRCAKNVLSRISLKVGVVMAMPPRLFWSLCGVGPLPPPRSTEERERISWVAQAKTIYFSGTITGAMMTGATMGCSGLSP